MTKRKVVNKKRRRTLLLGLLSIFIIFGVTFSIGKYWIEIFDKYQEKKELDEKLTRLKEKSLMAAFEKAEQSFVLDKEFFEKVKNQFVEKNQEEEN